MGGRETRTEGSRDNQEIWRVKDRDGGIMENETEKGPKMRKIRTVEGKIINVVAPSVQQPQILWKASPYIEIWTTWGAERQKRKFHRRMDKVWNRRLAGIEEESQVSKRGGEAELLSLARQKEMSVAELSEEKEYGWSVPKPSFEINWDGEAEFLSLTEQLYFDMSVAGLSEETARAGLLGLSDVAELSELSDV